MGLLCFSLTIASAPFPPSNPPKRRPMAQRTPCRGPRPPARRLLPASNPRPAGSARLGAGRGPAGPCCEPLLPQEGVRGAINGPGVRTRFPSPGVHLVAHASPERGSLGPAVAAPSAGGNGGGGGRGVRLPPGWAAEGLRVPGRSGS